MFILNAKKNSVQNFRFPNRTSIYWDSVEDIRIDSEVKPHVLTSSHKIDNSDDHKIL
jgi:hypothetical protein